MSNDEPLPHEDYHEVWWIYAPDRHPWGGARIAHFRKTIDGTEFFFITNEPPDRIGPRFWPDVAPREGWVKVKQIPLPTRAEIDAAVNAKLREIADDITKKVFMNIDGKQPHER